MTQAFDTLDAARKMEAAGMDRAQAETVAEAIRSGQDDLASKADLKAAISKLEANLTWRMVILAGVVIAAVKLIP